MMHDVLEQGENEKVLIEIRRHPIGLLPLLMAGVILLFLLLSGTFGLGRFRSYITEFVPLPLAWVVLVVLMLFLAGMLYVAFLVYIRNKLIVTNESLVQVLQHSLFNKQTSQLNLANVQDVTVHQNGFIPHFFNYGTLIIETAGEQSNFKFLWARNPMNAARVIIEAHEQVVPKG